MDCLVAEFFDAAEDECDGGNQEANRQEERNQAEDGRSGVRGVSVGLGGGDGAGDDGPERERNHQGQGQEGEAKGDIPDGVLVGILLAKRCEHRTARRWHRPIGRSNEQRCEHRLEGADAGRVGGLVGGMRVRHEGWHDEWVG